MKRHFNSMLFIAWGVILFFPICAFARNYSWNPSGTNQIFDTRTWLPDGLEILPNHPVNHNLLVVGSLSGLGGSTVPNSNLYLGNGSLSLNGTSVEMFGSGIAADDSVIAPPLANVKLIQGRVFTTFLHDVSVDIGYQSLIEIRGSGENIIDRSHLNFTSVGSSVIFRNTPVDEFLINFVDQVTVSGERARPINSGYGDDWNLWVEGDANSTSIVGRIVPEPASTSAQMTVWAMMLYGLLRPGLLYSRKHIG